MAFESQEHEKAWLIRVTINVCKDLLKRFFRSRTVSLDKLLDQPAEVPPDYREVLEAVLALPLKYRDVVYLHYIMKTIPHRKSAASWAKMSIRSIRS